MTMIRNTLSPTICSRSGMPQRHASGSFCPRWGRAFEVGEPLVIPVPPPPGRSAETAIGLSPEDVFQPVGREGRSTTDGGIPAHTGSSCRDFESRCALRLVSERAAIAAEDRRLEAHRGLSLPVGEDAESELQVAVSVTREGQERLVLCHSTSP